MTAKTPSLDTLLLIDDSEVDQMLYRRVIERSGIVRSFRSFMYADEALEFLQADPAPKVDLILLDINMPRMNGFEFLDAATEKLGPDFSSVIVMLTTSLDPDDFERAKRYEAVKEFLNKPLTVDALKRIAAGNFQ